MALDYSGQSVELEKQVQKEIPQLKCWQHPILYITLLKRNPRYRLYLLSHACQHIGDWYIRIASLLALDRLAPNSATALSILVLVKVAPQSVFPHLGGALADSFDRRYLMIALDTMGAFVTLLFIPAIQAKSITAFFIVAGLRATIHSIYEPATKSIVPMIVTYNPDDLKRAMTLNGLVWSALISVGGVVAGQTAAIFGVEACFVLDSVTYFISAAVLLFLRGNYVVPKSSEDGPTLKRNLSVLQHQTLCGKCLALFRPLLTFLQMTKALCCYLYQSGFGAVVFLKSTGSLLWGAADILNVEYAHVPDDEAATSHRLGLIFSCIGIGCFVGPISANFFTDKPSSIQAVCISALALIMLGWFGFSQSKSSFVLICVFTSVRAFGSSIIYINSSLLLQRLSLPEMLGRVLALEFASCMFFEAIVATITGRVVDAGIMSKNDIAQVVAMLAGSMLFLWSTYHLFRKGAAQPQFNVVTPSAQESTEKSAHVVFA